METAALLGPSAAPPPRGARRVAAELAAEAALAATYLRASLKRDARNWALGVATIALVVSFAAILQAGIETAPTLFLRLAEGQAGETDVTLVPERSADAPVPLLNFSRIEAALAARAPLVRGCAPRWALPVTLASKAEPGRRTAAILLAIDSDAEARIGLGRSWGRRRLGEEEAYVAGSALLETGVAAGAGERVVATFDAGALLAAVGGGSSGGGATGATSAAAANATALADALTRGVLQALGLGAVAASGDGDAAGAGGGDLGAVLAAVLSGNGSALADALPSLAVGGVGGASRLVAAAVAGGLASVETLAAEYTVVGAVPDPLGKYPSLLGNVVVVEAAQLALWLRGAALAALARARDQLAPLLALGGALGDALAGALDALERAARSFTYADMRGYAMTVSVMARDRLEHYLRQPPDVSDLSVADLAASVAAALGDAAPAAALTLLPDTLGGLRLLGLFLAQIFTIVIAVIAALSVVVTYALVGGDLEAKTYELGMLRALGMRRATLGTLLALNTAAFALPGLVVGLAVASAANVGIVYGMGWYTGLAPGDFLGGGALPPSAWGLAVGLGVVMPAVAVVAPIARALGGSLRDALDLYHTPLNALSVTVSKLKGSWGVDPRQTAVASLMAAAGVCTFVVLPQTFLSNNLALFLGLLSAVLLAMLLGLTLVALSVQGTIEAGVLAGLMGAWGGGCGGGRCARLLPGGLQRALDALLPDARLHTLAAKHLAGHRSRNRQTAAMVATTVAFIVFASALFSLQGASIVTNVKMLLGADIVAFVPEWLTGGVALPQEAMAAFLARSQATAGIVVGYSFVSLPLTNLPYVRRTQLANLVNQPRTSTRVYGVQRNLLDVAFAEYALVTEARGEGLDASVVGSSGAGGLGGAAAAAQQWATAHPVWALYDGAGGLRLPVEADAGLGSGASGASAGYPAPLLTGEPAAPLYVCGDDVAAAAAAAAATAGGASVAVASIGGAWDPSLGWRWSGSGAQWPPWVDTSAGGGYSGPVTASVPTGPNRSVLPVAQAAATVARQERSRVAAAAAAIVAGQPLRLPAYASFDYCMLACNLRPLPAPNASAAAVLAAACGASSRLPTAGGYSFFGPAPGATLAAAPASVCGARANTSGGGLPRPCVGGSRVDGSRQQRAIQATYLRYVDVLMSESLRGSASLDTATPLQIRVQVRDPATGATTTNVYMSKARAMARKVPGFFFSSYATLGGRAPVLTRMVDYARLLADAQASYRTLVASASASPTATASGSAVATPAAAAGSGSGSGSSSSSRAWPPAATWVASRPAWLLAAVPALWPAAGALGSPSAAVVVAAATTAGDGGRSSSPATLLLAPVGAHALDANASTLLLTRLANSSDVDGRTAGTGSLAASRVSSSGGGSGVNVTGGVLLTLDLGRCALLSGVRTGALPPAALALGQAGVPLSLSVYALSDAAAGGYKLVAQLELPGGGGARDVPVAPFSAQFWAVLVRPAATTAAAAAAAAAAPVTAVVVPELTLQLAEPPASGCKAPELAPDDALSSGAAPKQRLLVRLRAGATGEERQRVLNGLRSALSASGVGGGGGSVNAVRVQDTAELLASASLALLGLDILFYFVSVIALTLCFFAAWLSFTSLVKEGATELAVMRALGLSAGQVVRVFVYEALAVVLGAFVTGTAVGLAVSVSLSLQLGLFLELPFDLRFGYGVFIFMLLACVAMAVVASALPARALTRLPVAHVIKGRT